MCWCRTVLRLAPITVEGDKVCWADTRNPMEVLTTPRIYRRNTNSTPVELIVEPVVAKLMYVRHEVKGEGKYRFANSVYVAVWQRVEGKE